MVICGEERNSTAASSSSEPEIEGALDYLVRYGIKDNSNKRTEKPKSPEPKPARSTPVKMRREKVPVEETLSKESIKLPDQILETGSDIFNTKRQRSPTNRHIRQRLISKFKTEKRR